MAGVRQCPSPNADERPAVAEVSLLVIHNISLPPGQYGTGCIAALFANELDCEAHPYFQQLEGLRVSSHMLIERCGTCVQFVSFDRRAWHAGESEFDGVAACNDYSIGIELEGTDVEPYTDQQYAELARVTTLLMIQYPQLTTDRIVGHCDIAPARKTDPGPAFDWRRYRADIANGAYS